MLLYYFHAMQLHGVHYTGTRTQEAETNRTLQFSWHLCYSSFQKKERRQMDIFYTYIAVILQFSFHETSRAPAQTGQ